MRRVACLDLADPVELDITVVPPVPDPARRRPRASSTPRMPPTRSARAVTSASTTSASRSSTVRRHRGLPRRRPGDGEDSSSHGEAALDTATTVAGTGTDLDGDYADSNALARALSRSATVRACMARQLFRASTGRGDGVRARRREQLRDRRGGSCTADRQSNLIETLVAFVRSDVFVHRTTGPDDDRAHASGRLSRARRSFLRAIGAGFAGFPLLRALEDSVAHAAGEIRRALRDHVPPPRRRRRDLGDARRRHRDELRSDLHRAAVGRGLPARAARPAQVKAARHRRDRSAVERVRARFGRHHPDRQPRQLVAPARPEFVARPVPRGGTRARQEHAHHEHRAGGGDGQRRSPARRCPTATGGVPLPKIIDPVQAFDRLFGGLVLSDDPATRAAALRQQRLGKTTGRLPRRRRPPPQDTARADRAAKAGPAPDGAGRSRKAARPRQQARRWRARPRFVPRPRAFPSSNATSAASPTSTRSRTRTSISSRSPSPATSPGSRRYCSATFRTKGIRSVCRPITTARWRTPTTGRRWVQRQPDRERHAQHLGAAGEVQPLRLRQGGADDGQAHRIRCRRQHAASTRAARWGTRACTARATSRQCWGAASTASSAWAAA